MNANASHDAIDNTIDRALTALRDAQPRPGLEGRILASLEHRTAAPQPARFHISAHVTLWTAASAALLAIASLIILHQHFAPMTNVGSASTQHTPNSVILSERSESKNPEIARRATNAKPFSTTNLSRTTNTLSSRPERAARSGETPVFRSCPDHHDTGCPTDEDRGLTTTPTDAQLLADLHAPSHPAPPLPLTPQEKLFLRLLRYGNATQLAELNPMVRAKQDADETTAFKSFFPDPPPLQQPTGDSE
jgi:hypothetical protein